MRSADEFHHVRSLIAAGVNDCEISRQTGIPRPTIRDWRTRPPKQLRQPQAASACGIDHDFSALPPAAYSYLLGLYLGDGCISQHPRATRLRIVLDIKYPAIINRCREAMEFLMDGQYAGSVTKKGCVEVSMYSQHWPCLFPQHGPGRKHNRRIALEPWQQDLVDRATDEFIIGLIHSDGCRVIANDRGVTSIRYHFSNRSEDIINLFTAALDSLEIPWTRSTKYIVSIYRKAATAYLDTFVGPKARAVPWTNVHYTA